MEPGCCLSDSAGEAQSGKGSGGMETCVCSVTKAVLMETVLVLKVGSPLSTHKRTTRGDVVQRQEGVAKPRTGRGPHMVARLSPSLQNPGELRVWGDPAEQPQLGAGGGALGPSP